MIGKIIGAVVGGKVAQQTKSIGGPAGAAIGVASTMVLRRMSVPMMAVLAAGGYAYKKFTDKKAAEDVTPQRPPSVDPVVPINQKAA